MTGKIDFKKTVDAYRAQQGRFRIVEVPDFAVPDDRRPRRPEHLAQLRRGRRGALRGGVQAKFASKRDLGRDYVVPPLEGLWWAEDMGSFTVARDKSHWDWTLMLMVPDWIDQTMVTTAADQVGTKSRSARLDDVRLETLREGRCVQTLHLGSFEDEAEVLARMHHEFIPENELRVVGKHHEIYLSDLRKVAPERQRTILRQPVTAAVTPATSAGVSRRRT